MITLYTYPYKTSLACHFWCIFYNTLSAFQTSVPTTLLIHIKVKSLPSFNICFFQNVLLHNSDLNVTRLAVNTVLTENVTRPTVTAYLVLTHTLVFFVKKTIFLKLRVLVSVDKRLFSVNTLY